MIVIREGKVKRISEDFFEEVLTRLGEAFAKGLEGTK